MRLVMIALALALFAGCAQNPVTGQSDFVMMSESQEMAIGRQSDEQMVKKQYRVYESKALHDYVNSVGQKIAKNSHRPNLQYHFTVLDTAEINAFALPGGYVYITRGILAYLNSEAELAAVLGHEIGHVTARHGVRQQSASQATNIGLTIASIFVPEINTNIGRNVANITSSAMLSGYGRDHELEADRLGAIYLSRTDYDPQAIIRVISVLKNQELADAELARQEGREPRRYHGLFASHPDSDTRLQQAVGEADKNAAAHAHFEGRHEFLTATDGLVFNDSSEQGVVRNNRFYHEELGISVQFPETWQVHNQPSTLSAVSPKGEASLKLEIDQQPRGSVLEYARHIVGSDTQVRQIEVHGLPAALIDTPDSIGAVVYFNKQAFKILSKAKDRQSLAAHRDEIIATVRSFHALAEDERRLVKPLNIRVIHVRQGDTYAGLAQNSPLGKSAESYLRLINAQYPDGEPRAGQRVKIVE